MSDDDVRDLGGRLRTWGQWGPDDEKGALNHIDDGTRVAAARLVRRGAVFSLALMLRSGVGPQRPGGRRSNPEHVILAHGEDPEAFAVGCGASITDDAIAMPLQCSTQWDALCHVYYGGLLYNGYPAASATAKGAERDGIDKVHASFVGRGVLLDVARFLDHRSLPAGYAITADELDACAAAQGTELRRGDILMIRTGLMSETRRGTDWTAFDGDQPGLRWDVATWLRDHQVAAVAADNTAVEALHVEERICIPLHMLALRDLGIHLGEYWFLEDLAGDCAADGVYECLLVAQALPVVGGMGSPVNPIALK